MGAAVTEWELYTAYVIFEVIFRFGGACRVQQVMFESQKLWRDAGVPSLSQNLHPWIFFTLVVFEHLFTERANSVSEGGS